MAKIFKTIGGIVVGLTIFLIIVEWGSGYILRNGQKSHHPQPPHLITRWEQLDKELQNFQTQHPGIAFPAIIDHELMRDAPDFPVVGKQTKLKLAHRGMYRPDLDDTFVLRGKKTGRIKYEARYLMDSFGRRKTFFTPEKEYRSNLFFMGCSYTFGEGVNTENIFPSLIAKQSPQIKITNMGNSGSSASRELSRLETMRSQFLAGLDKSVPTYILFTFIDDHVRRIVGSSVSLEKHPYNIKQPYFFLDNDVVQSGGPFSADVWNFRWMYKAYGNTKFAKMSGIEIPTIGDSHLRLTAKIFSRIKSEMQKDFPFLRDFIVAVYPGENFYAKDLKSYLEKEGITVFDYSEIDLKFLLKSHHTLPGDPHPSILAHDFYSRLLTRDLKARHGEEFSCGRDDQCGLSAHDKVVPLKESAQFYEGK